MLWTVLGEAPGPRWSVHPVCDLGLSVHPSCDLGLLVRSEGFPLSGLFLWLISVTLYLNNV